MDKIKKKIINTNLSIETNNKNCFFMNFFIILNSYKFKNYIKTKLFYNKEF